MSDSTPAPAKDYTLHCHCGLHTITLHSIALDSSLKISCNCSICTDRGAILGFVPTSSVSFASGGKQVYGQDGLNLVKDTLPSYMFGKKTIQWRFCSVCGSTIMGVKEGDQWGVNVSTPDWRGRGDWRG